MADNNQIEKKITGKANTATLGDLEKLLLKTKPNLFEGLTINKKNEILSSLSTTLTICSHESFHSGPLPDPNTLGKYNDVIPNGADRIMKMAENQANHRIGIETRVIKSQSIQSVIGQIFGLLIGICGIFAGTYLASVGQSWVGSIIAGGTVISLVSIFVIGKRNMKKSLEK